MYHYAARLVSVTDGDTVRLDIDCGFDLWRLNQPYRLLRINAPERRYKSGKAAKAFLERFLDGKALQVNTEKSDVYGRFLVELEADAIPVSDYMVEHGHARYKEYA